MTKMLQNSNGQGRMVRSTDLIQAGLESLTSAMEFHIQRLFIRWSRIIHKKHLPRVTKEQSYCSLLSMTMDFREISGSLNHWAVG